MIVGGKKDKKLDKKTIDCPFEISYVVTWSPNGGWYVDAEGTQAHFKDGNVWVPQLEEWVAPVPFSEAGDFDEDMHNDLANRIKH